MSSFSCSFAKSVLQYWLKGTYELDGVAYQRMRNCECWGGESVLQEQKLKDAGIPLITLERERQMANAGQLALRAETFIEMIDKEG